ncbi:hypothetical protein BH10CYA1_BH10CYA1_55790 [soil metagenome]
MKAAELRNKFREYMLEQGHIFLPRASLVSDDAVLFTTSGVHPIIESCLEGCHPLGDKLASIQMCVRTGDIDEVGDQTHYTSFEMLGYWSLGAFGTERAIEIAFQFLTRLGIRPEHLTATVFAGDELVPTDELAEDLWHRLGVSTTRLGRSDNWWGPVSESGPCGPDTEIFYWTGEEQPPKDPDPTKDNRWVEIWNIVSMKYSFTGAVYEELPIPVIDTGGGFERILSILNSNSSAYQTDLFSLPSGQLGDEQRSRIVADHIRTAVRMLADGVVPSSQKHGAVLRRLVRRAVVQCGLVENTIELLTALALDFIECDGSEYEHINANRLQVIRLLDQEVRSSINSLGRGQLWFEQLTASCLSIIDGELAFRLQSEKGCPIELTKILAGGRNLAIDLVGFERARNRHRSDSKKRAS